MQEETTKMGKENKQETVRDEDDSKWYLKLVETRSEQLIGEEDRNQKL